MRVRWFDSVAQMKPSTQLSLGGSKYIMIMVSEASALSLVLVNVVLNAA